MQLWQKREMEKVMQGMQSVPITVWRADVIWTNPAKPDHKCWRLIGEKDGTLTWLHTYTKSLTEEGTHMVEMYLDTHGRRCIRHPRKD